MRHLAPLVRGRRIGVVEVHRSRVVRPDRPGQVCRAIEGARILGLARRAKYLVFRLQSPGGDRELDLIGHLGMTGRMYVQPGSAALPRHCAVALTLGGRRLVFEDTRYFGRLTLDVSVLEGLGPEPLDEAFTPEVLAAGLAGSRQAVKVRLLDQTVVAGVGNIYASEALFRARLSPMRLAGRLKPVEIGRLWEALRSVLDEAIRFGSTVPLDWAGMGGRDGLFYYGSAPGGGGSYEERLSVYGRDGERCPRCGGGVRRAVQAARSTFWCPGCQRG